MTHKQHPSVRYSGIYIKERFKNVVHGCFRKNANSQGNGLGEYGFELKQCIFTRPFFYVHQEYLNLLLIVYCVQNRFQQALVTFEIRENKEFTG